MISLRNITAQYGRRIILQDVSLEIVPGERVAITGRNGSGKSTLLQILAGISAPSTGTVTYFGEDVTRKRKCFSRYCGYIPQGNPLMEELTVMDNLRLWNGGYQLRCPDVLKTNGLEEIVNDRVSTLSGGMKRRLVIACAMLQMPPVMLMDEPTTALDQYYKELIWEWMDQYQKKNGTIIIVTHDKEEIVRCDRVYEVRDKKIMKA